MTATVMSPTLMTATKMTGHRSTNWLGQEVIDTVVHDIKNKDVTEDVTIVLEFESWNKFY